MSAIPPKAAAHVCCPDRLLLTQSGLSPKLKMIANWKRILAGLAVALVMGQLCRYFLPIIEATGQGIDEDFDSWVFRATALVSVWAFITYTICGFIARKKFLIPAVLFELATFSYGYLSGYLRSFGSTEVGARNDASMGILKLWSELGAYDFWQTVVLPALPLLVVPIAATAVGSLLGMKIYSALTSRPTVMQSESI